MATIREVITSTLQRYHIELSEAELDAKLILQGLNPTDAFNPSADRPMKLAIVSVIPELLLAPDVQEGDYAVKFDRNAIMRYYSLLCQELGVEDKLNPKPKIRNRSRRW